MDLAARIEAILELGRRLREPDEYRSAILSRTSFHNPWFTLDNQERAIASVAQHFLAEAPLRAWLAAYPLPEPAQPRQVGLVMAGNIPMVGFHDFLCVFLSGHHALIKLSDKDPYLFPYLLQQLTAINPEAKTRFQLQERLSGMDAVIATGSNNTARYFEAYFGKYPHIIRKNRNGVAVLTGRESDDQLKALGKDVFRYFGLGCRNVSKLYVPEGYVFDPLLEALYEYREIVLHSKYKNNFDYHYASYLLNRLPFLANGCVLLSENAAIPSPVACLHYAYYRNIPELEQELAASAAEIQVVVTAQPPTLSFPSVPFGQAQEPGLADYADGVDTLAFLMNI